MFTRNRTAQPGTNTLCTFIIFVADAEEIVRGAKFFISDIHGGSKSNEQDIFTHLITLPFLGESKVQMVQVIARMRRPYLLFLLLSGIENIIKHKTNECLIQKKTPLMKSVLLNQILQ